MKFEEKHINFYKKFILQTKTLNDGGVSASSDFASRINRSFNAEEKKEIERLRNLCQKEV